MMKKTLSLLSRIVNCGHKISIGFFNWHFRIVYKHWRTGLYLLTTLIAAL